MTRSKWMSTGLVAFCLSMGTLAQAAKTEPGLWEIQFDTSGTHGAQMAQAMKEMENMDPEQRKMMESMLAGMGINISKPNVIRTCITPEEAANDEVKLQEDDDCKQEIVEKSDKRMKMKFSCKDAEGTATVVFKSSKAYETTIETTVTEDGQKQQINQTMKAKWVQADCGSIK